MAEMALKRLKMTLITWLQDEELRAKRALRVINHQRDQIRRLQLLTNKAEEPNYKTAPTTTTATNINKEIGRGDELCILKSLERLDLRSQEHSVEVKQIRVIIYRKIGIKRRTFDKSRTSNKRRGSTKFQLLNAGPPINAGGFYYIHMHRNQMALSARYLRQKSGYEGEAADFASMIEDYEDVHSPAASSFAKLRRRRKFKLRLIFSDGDLTTKESDAESDVDPFSDEEHPWIDKNHKKFKKHEPFCSGLKCQFESRIEELERMVEGLDSCCYGKQVYEVKKLTKEMSAWRWTIDQALGNLSPTGEDEEKAQRDDDYLWKTALRFFTPQQVFFLLGGQIKR